ncbi:MAG TPA: hypothetical protein VMA77_01485 [Solirubrobacteraceae bacterium]|nr:hypothetical protein [Solirubrobacteraceae bacterium]
MLALADDWVWDSWVADDGERYHLFFLRAPRALHDPQLRHTAARIGHATSTDLTHWDVHADALAPEPGRWDDLALWTGSVARGDDGVWRLFYSALSTSRGLGVDDQRIGMAESDDLFTWRRVGLSSLVAPDPRWYATLDRDDPASATWRDPFVFKDPAGDGWHMLITARAAGAQPLSDGVLGHARSRDMRAWELGPPISEPGAGFGELEVSQARIVDGRPLLVFTCHPDQQTAEQRSAFGRFCTWSVAGESLTGPWAVGRARPFRGEPTLTAAPLVRRRDGAWALLGFRNLDPDAAPKLEVVDPIPVTVRDGELIDLR